MRIRKRQPPLHLPSFPTVPLSDPRPIHPSPMVQLPHASSPKSSLPLLLQQQPLTTALTPSLLPMWKPEDAADSFAIVAEGGAHDHRNQLDRSDEAGGGRDDGGEKRNDTGKGIIFGSGTVSEVIPARSSSNLDGKWCDDGEKAIPPKKRRGRGGDYMMMNTKESNNNKKMKTRMKTKMNKKCTQNEEERDGEGEDDDDEERKEEVNMDVNTSRKRGRGSVVMEGSRCSRVNGRGWRCCQQTLVGYSLCEHHLGKGRLRSMTSVRSRSIPSTSTAAKTNNDSLSVDDGSVRAASSSSPEKKSKYDSLGIHNDVDEHKGEKKPAVITKKRMKLGMVKARSISSLLGQTNSPPVTLHENNNK